MVPLPLWMSGLTPEMVRRAEVECGETPETRKRSLEEFKRLIDEEKGFGPLTDDSFLLRFLRAKKYNVKKAYKTFKNYYDFKNRCSGTITDLTPSQLKRVLEMDKVFIPPKRDLHDGGIMIIFAGSFDLENASPSDLFAASFLGAEIGLATEASQVCGSSLVFDFQGITLGKLTHFSSFTFLSMIVKGIQNCFPYRMNGFHIVNEPAYFSMTYNMVRPMLSKKLKERVHFHGSNLESLHSFLPPESLPKQLGGHLGEKDFEEYRSVLFNNEHFVKRLNKYVYNGQFSQEGNKDESSMNNNYVQRENERIFKIPI